MDKIKEFFQQQDGALCCLQYAIVFGFSIFWCVWLYLAFKNKTLPDVPVGLLSLLGIMLGTKVWKDSIDFKSSEQK